MSALLKNIIETTLQQEFEKQRFFNFINEMFNGFSFNEQSLTHQLNESERSHVRDFKFLGTFQDVKDEAIDVLIVELHSGFKIDRARNFQRNLIGKYLKANFEGVNNAIVAFYSTDDYNWRLSFVEIERKMTEKGVKTEVETPPKRFSFLVGKTEPSHTAQKQFIDVLGIQVREHVLVETIKKAFSIEKVTKEFYIEIAKLFTELVGGERKIGSQKFTSDGTMKYPGENDTEKKEFAVRLIGRLLFCWFLKKKRSNNGLALLTDEILSSVSCLQSSDYYHETLEPLFFEILNTNMNERRPDYKTGFWQKVPFLNGGLFEPHIKDHYELDSVLGKSKALNTLKVPNEWVLKLVKLFEEYNFTIDESASIDIDLAIDPEMLGRVFENLLAEINPETGETARKQTGSFYTPRPIVDYMVDESLIAYLEQKLVERSQEEEDRRQETGGRRQEEEERSQKSGDRRQEEEESSELSDKGNFQARLRQLISYTDEPHKFKAKEVDILINALDELKILDPACGSGAFPMGMLQKIQMILEKLDPNCVKWLGKVLEDIKDPHIRSIIKNKLEGQPDLFSYTRKLGIIQKTIYGVDIQEIAIEITKLRCFLSIIVDEKINDDEKNRGVQPLPNLEFKFVAANTLIGLPKVDLGSQLFSIEAEVQSLIRLRELYFNSYGNDKKKAEDEYLKAQNNLAKIILTDKFGGKEIHDFATKLVNWNPFTNESSGWFEPVWMYGIKDGFDIVIGNPPYGLINKKQNQSTSIIMPEEEFELLKQNILYKPALGGVINIFRFFLVKSMKLLNTNGIFSEIFPLSFIADSSMSNLRKFFLENFQINFIETFPERDNPNKRVFEAVKMSVCIMNATNMKNLFPFFIRINSDRFIDIEAEKIFLTIKEIDIFDSINKSIPLTSISILAIIKKLYFNSKRIGDYFRCYDGEVHLTKYKDCITSNPTHNPLLKGAIIDRFIVRKKMSQGIIEFLDEKKYLKNNSGDKAKHHSEERIVMQRITGVNETHRLKAMIIQKNFYCANSIGYIVDRTKSLNLKYILALLNSNLINNCFKIFSTNSNVNGYEIENLPVIIANKKVQNRIEIIVTKIIDMKDKGFDTLKLEMEIDFMVYKIYELNYDEVKIIDPNFALSQAEYENFELEG